MLKTLTETVFQEASPERVDAENGILYGVKLIGHESANGYAYTESCLKAAVPLYEGVKSYVDHPTRSGASDDRSIRDLTGEYRNPRYVEGSGIHADHHLLKSTDVFQGIIEAAQRFPKLIGYSHVADGDKQRRNGKELVDSIKKVFSVDHVVDAATTAGMFESRQTKDAQPQSLQEYIAALPEGINQAERTRLVEAITDAWPTAPGDPQQQITMALLSAVQELARSIMDANSKNAQADADAVAAKAAADKSANDKAAADKAKAENPGENVPPTLESLQRKLAMMEAEKAIVSSGRASKDEKVLAVQVESYVSTKAENRQALLESWPKAGEKKPQESRPFERPGTSPPASGADGDRETAGLKAYESRFTESLKGARERNKSRRVG